MGRFASTVAFYERYRPGYPLAFFQTIAHDLKLHASQRLIDLGTGPGLLAIGFAPFVGKVVGVDPEPAMLEEAQDAAARAGVHLTLIEATTETLPAATGTFHIVTIGRALHWMEREPTLQALDRIMTSNGVILIASSRTDARADRNAWLPAYDAVRERWTPKEETAHRRHRDLEAFFAGSPFKPEKTIEVLDRHTITLDDLIGRTLSFSSSSPDRLGNRADLMAEDLKRTLAPFAPDGSFEEVVVAQAAVIRR